MKNLFQTLLLLALLLAAHFAARAQVGVGTTAPDAKSALDIRATDKGLLIPRLTVAQRTAITAPPQGLMVYQTDGTASGGAQTGFWYYAGTPAAWVFLSPGGDNLGNHTATQDLNLQGNALTGTGADLGSTVGLGVRADGGLNLGQNTSGNLLVGYQAGQATTNGYHNQFSGYQSGTATTTGSENLFSGYKSGFSNLGGSNNLFSGSFSGFNNLSGYDNLYGGYNSGYTSQTGHDNVYLGHTSGQLSTGSYNVLLGSSSGFYDASGTQLTAVGYGSGPANGSGALTNATALGANARLTQNNTVVLGNNADVGIGTSAPGQKLEVAGNVKITGTAGTTGLIFPDGTKQTTAATGSGFTLPYSGSASSNSPIFSIHNNGTGTGLFGESVSFDGVAGFSGTGYGVRGYADNGGIGVAGIATTGSGLAGYSDQGSAILGAKGTGQTGRVAYFLSQSTGNDSTAVVVSTLGTRPALRAVNTNTSSQAAIRGVKQSAAANGIGVEGIITSGATGSSAGVLGNDKSGSGGGSGVTGLTTTGYGVRGIASANGGYGVSGTATNSYGVIGSSTSGMGVYGTTQANSNTVGGVTGSASGGASAVGVLGLTTSGYGVRGVASANGGYGVQGIGTDSYGVTGTSSSGVGTYGISTSTYGVQGVSTSSSGVYGSTAAGNTGGVAGVEGASTNSSGIGVLGTATSGYGVRGEATGSSGFGVSGVASGNNGYGLIGTASGGASGVYGGASGTGRAAYFNQSNAASTAPAVEINQTGTGPALQVKGEVNANTTGTANMLPVAYGRIDVNGTKLAGTSNWTVQKPDFFTYRITFTSPDLNQVPEDQLIVQCATVGAFFQFSTSRLIWSTITLNGAPNGSVDIGVSNITLRNGQVTGVSEFSSDISFVIYKP